MRLTNINQRYDDIEVFSNFSIEIPENEITVILGNSGVGKTSLLKIIADLVPFTGERIGFNQKRFATVFAEQRLLKNLTVYENLDYILANVVKNKRERERIIRNKLESFELSEKIYTYPKALSTGLAQRVALTRALIFPADIILMDEAFRGLDISLKVKFINLFYDTWKDTKQTIVMVTHDINEGMLLADNIVIIGKRPAQILFEKKIEIPQNERVLASEYFGKLYSEIISYFLK